MNCKGQLFSLDFLVAIGIIILCFGMILGYNQISVQQAKDAQQRNELLAIAINAGNLIIETNRCTIPGVFANQGYSPNNCVQETLLAGTTRSKMMIPTGYSCMISWHRIGTTVTTLSTNCQDNPENALERAAVDRNFFVPTSGSLEKSSFEQCINGSCSAYQIYDMNVVVWK